MSDSPQSEAHPVVGRWRFLVGDIRANKASVFSSANQRVGASIEIRRECSGYSTEMKEGVSPRRRSYAARLHQT